MYYSLDSPCLNTELSFTSAWSGIPSGVTCYMLTLDIFSFCCNFYSARSQFSTSDNLTGRKNHVRLLWYAYYWDLLSFSINRRPWCNNISPSKTIQDGAPIKHYQVAFQLRQTFSILDNTKLTGNTLINPAHLYLGQEQTRPFSLWRFHSNPHTDASVRLWVPEGFSPANLTLDPCSSTACTTPFLTPQIYLQMSSIMRRARLQ